MILVNMSVGFFSFAMFVLCLAFAPWETVQRMSKNVTEAGREYVGVDLLRRVSIPPTDGCF
jgi:hypothetical protein